MGLILEYYQKVALNIRLKNLRGKWTYEWSIELTNKSWTTVLMWPVMKRKLLVQKSWAPKVFFPLSCLFVAGRTQVRIRICMYVGAGNSVNASITREQGRKQQQQAAAVKGSEGIGMVDGGLSWREWNRSHCSRSRKTSSVGFLHLLACIIEH